MNGTIPPPKFVYVNSGNSLGSQSQFSTLIQTNGFEYDRIVLMNCTLTKTYYNINSNNNSFIVEVASVNYPVTLAVGNYNRKTFQTALKTALDTCGAGLTWTISYPTTNTVDTGKFTYSTLLGTTVTFKFTTGINVAMGFNENTNYTFTTLITSPNVINLTSESSLFLHCSLIQGEDDILETLIFNDTPNYSALSYTCNDPFMFAREIKVNHDTTAVLSLSDENGNYIDLNNGTNIVCTLLLFHSDQQQGYSRKLFQMYAIKQLNKTMAVENL